MAHELSGGSEVTKVTREKPSWYAFYFGWTSCLNATQANATSHLLVFIYAYDSFTVKIAYTGHFQSTIYIPK